MNTQPDNEMVERVAKAIESTVGKSARSRSFEEYGNLFADAARAAINVVMEWRYDMKNAPDKCLGYGFYIDQDGKSLVEFIEIIERNSDPDYPWCDWEGPKRRDFYSAWQPLSPLPKQEGET